MRVLVGVCMCVEVSGSWNILLNCISASILVWSKAKINVHIYLVLTSVISVFADFNIHGLAHSPTI